MKKKSIFLFFLGWMTYAWAQHPPELKLYNNYYSYRQWTTDNSRLPQNSISGLVQASDGYIWLSTFDGILRFDGQNFNLLNSQNVEKMKSNMILGLLKDSVGIIFAMTTEELLEIDSNRVKRVLPLPTPVHEIGGIVSAGKSGFLIFNEHHIYRFDKQHFKEVPLKTAKTIMNLTTDGSGQIYLVLNDNGEKLAALEPDGTVRSLNRDVKSIVQRKYPIPEAFVMTGNSLLVAYEGEIIREEKLPIFKDQKILGHILVKKNMTLWDTDKGLILETPEGYFDFTGDFSLKSIRVSQVMEDANGDIWIGTLAKGLIKLSRHTFNYYDWQYGINGYSVYLVYGSPSGKLYVGDGCYGVHLWDKASQRFLTTPYKGCIWTMAEDTQGNTWFSSWGGGIEIFSGTHPLKHIGSPELRSSLILSLYPDQHRSMWIGTNKGIYRVAEFDYQQTPILMVSDSMEVYRFYEHGSKIFVATNNGIYVFENNRLLRHYSTKDGLPTNDTRCIFEEENGTIWVGTAKCGLVRIANNKVLQFPYGKPNGLNRNIWTLAYSNGYFWMSSNNGIYRVALNDLNNFANSEINDYIVGFYGRMDGIKNTEFNSRTQNAYVQSKDGSLWFCSVEGVATIARAQVPIREAPKYAITIEKIFVDDSAYVYLDTPTVISYKNRIVRVSFNYPSFENRNRVKYEYFVDGFTEKWFPVLEGQVVTLGYLLPGNYRLHVRIVGTPKETTMDIEVPTPFWIATWFRLLMGGVLIALAVFITAWIIRRKNRQKIQAMELRGRMAKLEMNALKAQMNPHFAFNCLSSIQYLYVKGDMDKANTYMSHFSQMLRELIDYTRLDGVSLRKKVLFLEHYISLENLQFQNPFDYEINVQEDIDQDAVILPSLFIQPYVENAIKHGLKTLRDRKGKLRVAFSQEGNKLTCIITDNGIGRAASAHKTKRQSHKTNSTQINNERIELISRLNHIDIHVDYKDLFNEQGEAEGTQVKIEFIYTKQEGK